MLCRGQCSALHREASLPQEYIPQISAAVQKAGLKWSDFKVTDNSCPPHPPPSSLVDKVPCNRPAAHTSPHPTFGGCG